MTEARGRRQALLAHRVDVDVDPGAVGPDPGQTVTPEDLDRLLTHRSGWHAADLVTFAGPSTKPRYLLTFDDGYRDNLTRALPLLERHGVPAIVFVTTGFVSRTAAPMESRLAGILAAREMLRLPDGGRIDCPDVASRRRAYDTLRADLKRLGGAARDRRVEELAGLNEIEMSSADERFLDWDGVRELDRHPLITIGAHTRTHPLLTRISSAEARDEIEGGKRDLEAQLGHPVEVFAYPYGGHGLMVRRMVARAGFRYGFTTEARDMPRRDRLPLYRLPRVDLRAALVEATG